MEAHLCCSWSLTSNVFQGRFICIFKYLRECEFSKFFLIIYLRTQWLRLSFFCNERKHLSVFSHVEMKFRITGSSNVSLYIFCSNLFWKYRYKYHENLLFYSSCQTIKFFFYFWNITIRLLFIREYKTS